MVTGIVVGAVVAWWLIKRPPKIVKWILNNKLKSLGIFAAAYLGISGIQKTISHVKDREEIDRTVEQIKNESRARRQAKEQKKAQAPQKTEKQKQEEAVSKAEKQKQVEKRRVEFFQKAKEKKLREMAEKRKAEATRNTEGAAVLNNAFTATPQELSVQKKMSNLIDTRAKLSSRPDLSGMHSLLIYQAQNPTNHVVLHVGFHANPSKQGAPYRVYESNTKTQDGIMPVKSQFNIRFAELPDIMLGVSADENGVKLTNVNQGKATISLAKDKGRSALRVEDDGSLSFLTDKKDVDAVFAHVNLEQKGLVSSRSFTPYNTYGKYKYPTQIYNPQVQKGNGGR